MIIPILLEPNEFTSGILARGSVRPRHRHGFHKAGGEMPFPFFIPISLDRPPG